MECEDYILPEALVLCNDNMKTVGNITYAPVYMVMFLQPRNDVPSHYEVDISMLS